MRTGAVLLKPPRLTPGATIGVAAVSGPVDETRLEAGLRALISRGYQVVEASNLRRRDGFLAGADAERAAGYRELVNDRGVDAIFFARGGYGASRILRFLRAEEIRSSPKIHLGGSDLTALFAYVATHASLATFYGPLVSLQLADARPLDWRRCSLARFPLRTRSPRTRCSAEARVRVRSWEAACPSSLRSAAPPKQSGAKAPSSSGRTSGKRPIGSTEC